MKKLYSFVLINYKILLGMLLGSILGYIHWFYWGCYWGAYALSAECWVNCTFGILTGGFVVSFIDSKI